MKVISLRLEDEIYEKIKKGAESEHRSMNGYINLKLNNGIKVIPTKNNDTKVIPGEKIESVKVTAIGANNGDAITTEEIRFCANCLKDMKFINGKCVYCRK